VNNFAFHDTLK